MKCLLFSNFDLSGRRRMRFPPFLKKRWSQKTSPRINWKCSRLVFIKPWEFLPKPHCYRVSGFLHTLLCKRFQIHLQHDRRYISIQINTVSNDSIGITFILFFRKVLCQAFFQESLPPEASHPHASPINCNLPSPKETLSKISLQP